MSSSVSPQNGVPRARVAWVVSALVMLMATPCWARATPQQDTVRPPRARLDTSGVRVLPSDTGLAAIRAARVPVDTSVGRRIQGRRMPYLIGLDTLTAIRQLRSLRVTRYVIQLPRRGLVPIDSIVSQHPRPDSMIRGGDTVRLALTGRVPPPVLVAVPYVVGLSAREAAATLAKMRLVAAARDEPAAELEWIARVMRQAPDSGQRLSPGSTVTVWVGRDTRVPMPLVTGQTEAEASGVLRKAGVVAPPVVDVMPGEGEPFDSIVRQAPDPGMPVWPETRAVLTLAKLQPTQQDSPPQPPQPPRRLARVPWIVGLDSATAIRTLAGQGLRNYQIRLPLGGRPENVVAAQSPDSGGRVPIATRVMLALRARQADSVFVPLVIGLTVDSARTVLDEAGLGTRVDALGGEALVGRAKVRNQLPDVGAIVPAGTTVTIAPANVLAAILVIALLLGGGVVAARALCPTPKIAQLVRLYPAHARVTLKNEPLVVASVSLRSHMEHRGAGLDITGSLLA